MQWISTLIYAMAAVYALMNFGVLIGSWRQKRVPREPRPEPHPFVTILVAARNEEQNITVCLNSLLNQDYPADCFEVLLINDRSTDRTRELAEALAERHPNLVLRNITQDPTGITGKQNAIMLGLREARGEFILNTDADCVVPPTWISRTVAHFGEKVGLVIGMTVMHAKDEKASLFARFQSLDLCYLLHAAIGTTGWGLPATCIGNNFAYRRKMYDELGGYETIGYCVAEEAALFAALRKQGTWQVSAAEEPGAHVVTLPEPTLKRHFRQRMRWVVGGKDSVKSLMGILNFILLYHLVLLASPALYFVPALRLSLVAAIASKIVTDFLVVLQAARRIRRYDLLFAFLPFEIYFIAYSSLIGIASLFAREIEWKGQKLVGRQRDVNPSRVVP